MDISNNQSIIFKTVSVASYVLCAAESTLLNYAKNGNLFSYFEWDSLNNCVIERKLLITYEK